LSELSNDCEEIYVILARIGEIYMQGGFGVDQYLEEAVNFFNEAADKAMQSGKGRLANKYFSLSEKAAALL
jgi:TPR repeat protein